MGDSAHQVTLVLSGLTITVAVVSSSSGARAVQLTVEDPSAPVPEGRQGGRPRTEVVVPAPGEGASRAPGAGRDSEAAAVSQEFEPLTGSGAPAAAPPSPASPATREAEEVVVARLARGRLVSLGGLDTEGRIRRAIRLGRSDAAVAENVREGGSAKQAPDRLPGQRSVWYVVLEGVPGAPLATRAAAEYFSLVTRQNVFIPESVSRAFGSEAEATAYCFGAGLEPPYLPSSKQ